MSQDEYYLFYVDDPTRPATVGGRVLAHPQRFTAESAARKIEELRAWNWLRAVSDGVAE